MGGVFEENGFSVEENYFPFEEVMSINDLRDFAPFYPPASRDVITWNLATQ